MMESLLLHSMNYVLQMQKYRHSDYAHSYWHLGQALSDKFISALNRKFLRRKNQKMNFIFLLLALANASLISKISSHADNHAQKRLQQDKRSDTVALQILLNLLKNKRKLPKTFTLRGKNQSTNSRMEKFIKNHRKGNE